MNMRRGIGRVFGWAVLALAWHLQCQPAVARPRPAMPPYPERVLGAWRFDDTNMVSLASSSGFQHNVLLVEGWSGYALSMEGRSSRLFALPMVAESGKTNLSANVGTIRFWFRPSWSSSSVDGKGPKQGGRLLEVGAWGRNSAVAWWSLQFDNTGDTLALVAQSGGECASILSVPIQWVAGEWHQITLSYSPAGSWLFLDGQMVAQGQAVALVPLDSTPGNPGFCVGSDVRGANLAQGQFDELTTFGSVQRTDLVGWNFSCLAGTAALGPITPQEDAARAARMVAMRASASTLVASAGLLSDASLLNQAAAYFAESGDTNLWFLPPVVNGTNIILTLYSAAADFTNKGYEVYYTSVLLQTNTAWCSTGVTGQLGQITFAFPTTNPVCFFRATEGSDWDGDGIANWQDADPRSSNVNQVLTITILSPTNTAKIY